MANDTHIEHMRLQGLPTDVVLMSSHMRLPKAAQVLKKADEDTYGIRTVFEGRTLGIEWFEGKTESWVDDAAEDWVLNNTEITID